MANYLREKFKKPSFPDDNNGSMGTTSSSLGSTSTPSAASIAAPLYFTGLSSFSSDFQSIIQRAVQIADIPVLNLKTSKRPTLPKSRR